MKVITVVGTRPELIKLSEIIKKLDQYTKHYLIHTRQNYDYELNEIFNKDLDLRHADLFLSNDASSSMQFIGEALPDLEDILATNTPDAVVILGDTNSCLATAIVAKRLKIPLFHLEAGNRCFDDNVPEEVNRRAIDHISDINLVYTENARRNLLNEGLLADRIYHMGSPMTEILDKHQAAIRDSKVLDDLGLEPYKYFVASFHREENLDNKTNLKHITNALNHIAFVYEVPIILTTHPRTAKKLKESKIKLHKLIKQEKPFGFLDYVFLQANAKCTLSDSGTIAEESAILGFPAVTIRNAIERPEAIDAGSLIMSGTNLLSIVDSVRLAMNNKPSKHPTDYDDTNCSDKVLSIILGYTDYINRKVYNR